MKTNYHTHTALCRHASGTVGQYAAAAEEEGLSALGFSDHAPFPECDLGYRMLFSELDGYIRDINAAKKLYDGRMRIYSGLEIEYFPTCGDYYKRLLDKETGFGLDYLVLGQHYFGDSPSDNTNIAFVTDTMDFVRYADSIAEALATGLFAFCAHPDIFYKLHIGPDKNCDHAVKTIITAAEKYDIPLEFNANGLRRGIQPYPDGNRYPYPHERFWRELSGSKMRVVIGADAHIPEQIWDRYLDEAYDMCSKLDLNVIPSLF